MREKNPNPTPHAHWLSWMCLDQEFQFWRKEKTTQQNPTVTKELRIKTGAARKATAKKLIWSIWRYSNV